VIGLLPYPFSIPEFRGGTGFGEEMGKGKKSRKREEGNRKRRNVLQEIKGSIHL